MARRPHRNPDEEWWGLILDDVSWSEGIEPEPVDFTPELVREIQRFEKAAQAAIDKFSSRFPPASEIVVGSSNAYDIYQYLAGAGVGVGDGRWDEYYPDFTDAEWNQLMALLDSKLGGFVDGAGGGTLTNALRHAVLVASGKMGAPDLLEAIRTIQDRRKALWQPPLDLSEWRSEDIIEFAQHGPSRRNPDRRMRPGKRSRRSASSTRKNPPAISLPVGSTLFHGSIEPLKGRLQTGGYDEVLWFADDPRIAQLYIPRSGTTMMAGSQHIARPSKDEDIQKVQNLIGVHFDLDDVGWDRLGRPQSFRIPEIWTDMELSDTFADTEARIESLGYQPRRPAPPGMRAYQFHIADGRILPPGGVQQGSLCVARTKREMLLWPKSRGEGDLTELQYHDVDGFQAARRAGYDGVIIDDFAQSEAYGNFGHLSVGLFEEAISDLRVKCVPATYEEWDRDRVGTMAYPHPSPTNFTSLLGTVKDVDLPRSSRANPERAFASVMAWSSRR